MDIREFRIDRFGCWQDVTVNSLPTGVTVIHLDDGGRPADLSTFLHNVLFGFDADHHTAAGGAVIFADGTNTLTIDRQTTSNGSTHLHATWNGTQMKDSAPFLDKACASLAPQLAERFFLPTDELGRTPLPANHVSQRRVVDRITPRRSWEWLMGQPELQHRLQLHHQVEDDNQARVVHSTQNEPSIPSQAAMEEQLRKCRQDRARLLQEIETCQQRLDQAREQRDSPHRIPRLTVEQIDDELSTLRSRQVPLKQALRLVDKWRERAALRVPEVGEVDLERLRAALVKFHKMEKTKAKNLSVLKASPAPKQKPRPKRQSIKVKAKRAAIRRLLEQRDWVLQTRVAPVHSAPVRMESSILEPPSDLPDEVTHAARLLEETRRESREAEKQWATFLEHQGTEWSDPDEVTPIVRTEIAAESSVSAASLDDQLAELRRRRLWVEQEHECLLERHSESSQTTLWIVLLFSLSVAALFGVLVVVSYVGQLMLIAVGLGGIVASGALKMSVDRRGVERIRRTNDRLHQIDQEIGLLEEQLCNKDRAAEREKVRAQADSLQQQLTAAHRRVESAEAAFYELSQQYRYGAPQSIARSEAATALPEQHHEQAYPAGEASWKTDSPPTLSLADRFPSDPEEAATNDERIFDLQPIDPKLERWVKAAKKLIRGLDDAFSSDEPQELLAQLEHLEQRLTAHVLKEATEDDLQRKQRRYVIREAKREIGRLNKVQQSILRRVKMHDVFELESAIEKAIRRQELHQQWSQLNEEITEQLNACDDGLEVRELLESFDLPELQSRHDELLAHQTELKKLRQEAKAFLAAASTSDSSDEDELLRERDQLNRQLAETEQKLERVEKQRDQAAAKRARENDSPPDHRPTSKSQQPACRFDYLARLTADRFDTMRLDNGQLVLSHSKRDEHCAVDFDSDFSRLAWLAVRLRLAATHLQRHGESIPLVVMADDLFALPQATDIYDVLQHATTVGVQILLLSGNQQIVNRLVQLGTAAVRIGLHKDSLPTAANEQRVSLGRQAA